MAWWQWPFFYIGVATTFSLTVVLTVVALYRIRAAAQRARSDAAPNRPKTHDSSLATTEQPSAVISTEARVG
jgi:hypothetical protein